jgi:mono/diheme cytochrome c family protein
MSIEVNTGVNSLPLWRSGPRRFAMAFGVLILAAGCGGEAAESAGGDPSAIPLGGDAAAVTAAPAAEAPTTVAEIFPEGPGKQLVLNNCASCHQVACAAIGQRPAGRWTELREAHREHAPGLGDEDLTAIFAYLSSNFGSDRPEPLVPPEFLAGGCTPF